MTVKQLYPLLRAVCFRFTLAAVVGTAQYTSATAGTKKEARRRAALIALEELAAQGRVLLHGHLHQDVRNTYIL